MTRYCAACGAAVEAEARFCPGCGADLNEGGAASPEDVVPIFLQREANATVPAPGAAARGATDDATDGATHDARVLPFAGFGRRFAAWFIDFLIFRGIWFVFILVTGVTPPMPGFDMNFLHPGDLPLDMEAVQEFMRASARLGLVQMLIWWTYMTLFVGLMGQTPGKMALRVRVVDAAGRVPGLARAFAREVVGKTVSQVVLFLGFLWIAIDARNQGWHDKIAGTFVVRTASESPQGLAVG